MVCKPILKNPAAIKSASIHRAGLRTKIIAITAYDQQSFQSEASKQELITSRWSGIAHPQPKVME